jgi:hypothetical protein
MLCRISRDNYKSRFMSNPAQPEPPALPSIDRSKCVVLVPVWGSIDHQCELALRGLETAGYAVWRVPGFSAIDVARNRIAADALASGFEETLWIDSDIFFRLDDVERLRSHALPIACAVYAKQARRELAVRPLPGTEQILFGCDGGLTEVLYCGGGFLLVRRQVYADIQEKLKLPVCDQRFGRPMVPYFQPMVLQDADGHRYLGDDYAFCERARRCGYAIWADTTIRLGHIGSYPYSWEDAGEDPRRFQTYRFLVNDSR